MKKFTAILMVVIAIMMTGCGTELKPAQTVEVKKEVRYSAILGENQVVMKANDEWHNYIEVVGIKEIQPNGDSIEYSLKGRLYPDEIAVWQDLNTGRYYVEKFDQEIGHYLEETRMGP